MLIALLVFFVVLFVLVIAHECGHFFAARFFGIRVEEFGFGLPPRITGIMRKGTLYSINWLPLGGFVKIFGEEGGQAASSDSFGSKAKWKRSIVLGAGIVANIVLAWIFFSIISFSQPYTILAGDVVPTESTAAIMILDVSPASPAATSGMVPGDIVVGLNNGDQNLSFASIELLRESLQKNAGTEISLAILRDGSEKVISVIPRQNPPQGEGSLGVALGWTTPSVWYRAPIEGAYATYEITRLTVVGIISTFGELFRGNADVPVSGPVGIYKITDQARHQGILSLLFLMGALSVSLAVFNVLPIPGLDGGRLFFVLIEAITGKRISEKTSTWIHGVGLITLLILIVFITGLDIKRYF